MMTTQFSVYLTVFVSLLFTHRVPSDNPEAPLFKRKGLNGEIVELEQLRGKVVVLNFWATWCGPCRAEIPGFLDAYKHYRDKGVEIIGVSLDQGSEEEVRSFVQRYEINYPVVIGDGSIAKLYGGIQAIPTTFFIDRSGKIRGKHIGYMSKQQVKMAIEKLL